jgi:DNA-binding NarL/FixJ family response regulator
MPNVTSMILVFDREGSIFTLLRELDLGLPLWRVTDPSRLEHVEQIELAVVASYADVPWDLLSSSDAPFDAIVLTDHFDEAEALDALGRGLSGYMDARGKPQALKAAIQGCLAGEPAYERRLVGRWLRGQRSCARSHCNAARLTERQQQVLHLVAQGLADKEIAERLGIATATAQKHVTNILERLHVTNRAAAAAAVCGLLTAPLRRLASVPQMGVPATA